VETASFRLVATVAVAANASDAHENRRRIMTANAMYTSLKVVGYVVVLSMIGSLAFAAYISLTHWTGIGV
jgi:hypothetical protein